MSKGLVKNKTNLKVQKQEVITIACTFKTIILMTEKNIMIMIFK